jgi:hypothetical protein
MVAVSAPPMMGANMGPSIGPTMNAYMDLPRYCFLNMSDMGPVLTA